jgi:long-chain acyl-CoA synthetase
LLPSIDSKQDFTNGWFFTGDIGRWIDGRLYIVDRKKNLVKLSSGEYIALEKLETFYKESALVENIMVSANTADDFLVAVVQVPQKSMHKSSEEIKEELKQELEKIAQNNNLSRAEHIERILIDTEPWTPENGLVTATAKLNRNELLKKFMDQLKGIQEPQ